MSAANRYRLVVGEPGSRCASAFHAMTLRADDGETDITGPISDQSHLQGLIERIAGLGLTLHSVTPLETEDAEAVAQPDTHPAGTDRSPGTHSKGP